MKSDASGNTITIDVLYFASLRERFGVDRETVELPEGSALSDAIALLAARGDPWSAALAPGKAWRAAVDQAMATLDRPLAQGSEVAIFPPVTGG
jgi:sulfur-carrier protein